MQQRNCRHINPSDPCNWLKSRISGSLVVPSQMSVRSRPLCRHCRLFCRTNTLCYDFLEVFNGYPWRTIPCSHLAGNLFRHHNCHHHSVSTLPISSFGSIPRSTSVVHHQPQLCQGYVYGTSTSDCRCITCTVWASRAYWYAHEKVSIERMLKI